MEGQTTLLDAMKDRGVERVRFQQRRGAIDVKAATPDGDWTPVPELLPESDDNVATISSLLRRGGHERLELTFREETGLRFICAVHSTKEGPGAGGLRRHDPITTEREVIGDALNLARAMTYKNRVAGVQRGGSKLVLHNSPPPEQGREAWVTVLAEEIDFSGTITGPDTGLPGGIYHDLAQKTPHVTGIRGGGTTSTAAFGVREAIKATIAALGLPLSEAHVAIQGLGGLGTAVAAPLLQEGARVTVTDRDHRRIDALLSSLTAGERRQVEIVAPYQIIEIKADVLAPCAVGAVVTPENTGKLRCRAICGGANNQLAGDSLEEELSLARRLMSLGILYVPDWLASAGGTIHGTMELEAGEDFDPSKARARVRRICGWRVNELLDTAKRTGRAPLEIAVEDHLS